MAGGELVELLAAALRRARTGANDVGIARRVRAAADESISNPSARETLSDWNSSTYRAPEWAHPTDWALARNADGGLERPANPLAAHGGEVDAPLTDYDRALMKQNDAHLTWAPGATDDIGRMIGPDGELVPPEQFLGRPLTPDHIWNDPAFQRRLDMTADLEGIKTPEERFHIAAERERQMLQQGPHKAATERWGVNDPVVRMALIGGGVGGGLSLREALRQRQWSA